MASVDLDAVHALALQLGKNAGKMLDDGWRLRVSGGAQAQQVEKDSAVDIVTQTDLDVEAFIKTQIHLHFPSHK
ncbi:hypothetical protein LTR17_002346 [Elasticomyces elasticus]|nr:hypothetical protein LTR17_002346 [Elasticomyces elasticus]